MIPTGRVALAPPVVLSVRPITREDLPRLLGPRDRAQTRPQRLRASHHRVAELAAMGFRLTQIAMMTGYSYNRVASLLASPAMQELVAVKEASKAEMQAVVEDTFADYSQRNMLTAERMLFDRLDEADDNGDLLPVRDLIAITADRADRFGYPKKSTSVNLNVDFAARLEAVIARSAKARVAPPALVEDVGSPSNVPTRLGTPQPLLRRRVG